MKQRNILIGGLSLVLMASVSSAAIAQCTTSTGAPLIVGLNLAPIATGGAVNTLISSINAVNTAFLTQSTAFVSAPANPAPGQEGGGVWARGIGGEIKTKNQGTSTYTIPGVGPVPGSVNCDNTTRLTFSGVQVGTDGAKLNWNGWNVHVGSTAGYLNGRARDTSPAGVANPAGGTFANSLEVPFVGVYAAATYGSFFIDGQVRWDYYQNTLNDPTVNSIFDQKLNARGIAFTANAGYNFQLGNGWFIEPSAGIVVSKVEVDSFNTPGTFVTGTGLAPPGTVQVGDINSALGRLSVRAGTTIVGDTVVWQPFVTASVYHDFKGNVTTTFTSDAALSPIPVNAVLNTNGLGTYGQFALGVAGQLTGTGWLGYVRADYRTGDRIEGYSLNGGLRYQFSPDRAPLAPKGLITKAPLLASAPYNWTGLYIGGTFGGYWGRDTFDVTPAGIAPTAIIKPAGAMAGGQIGYDWQIGKWVVGLEGFASWTNTNGASPLGNAGVQQFFTAQSGADWIATVTGRVGYALFDRTLLYVKGGYAAAGVTAGFSCTFGNQPFGGALIPGCPGLQEKRTRNGWTIGYGTEFALSQNWTVKGETNYFDFGTDNYPVLGVNLKNTGMNGTVGLNYRFATGGPLR